MALQEQPPSGRSPPRAGGPKKPSTIPACPQCQRRMTVKRVAPVLFASSMDDVIYGCEKCGTEVRRTKRT